MKFLTCNWKTYIDTIEEATAIIQEIKTHPEVKTIVCPSAIHLKDSMQVMPKNIYMAAQDISVESEKPQTGRSSGRQLKKIGVKYVLVGHTEVRAQGVTNLAVAQKAVHALQSGIIPIICMSDIHSAGTLDETIGDTESQQLEEILLHIQENTPVSPRGADVEGDTHMEHIIVAYEPAAYIGSTATLPAENIAVVRKKLDNTIRKHYRKGVPILYGGSVVPSGVKELLEQSQVDGVLVGRAGTTVESINQLIQYMCI